MRSPELVDISKDFQTSSQRRRRRLLRVVIPVGCVVFMIVAIASIVAFAYQNNRKDALALSEDLLEALGSRRRSV